MFDKVAAYDVVGATLVNVEAVVHSKVIAMKSDDHRIQADKFRDLARELECHEDEAAFDEKVRKVATAPLAFEKPDGGKNGHQREDRD